MCPINKPFQRGTVFIRQIMTSTDGLRTGRTKLFILAVDPYVGIQMSRKELTKTFMMILNWKTPFSLHGSYTNMSALWEFMITSNSHADGDE